MPSRPRTSYAAFILSALSLTDAVASAHAHGVSPLDRKLGTMNKKRATLSYNGCYSSSDGLSSVGTYTYQSSGYCQEQCVGKNQAVLGLSGGDECYCGDTIPEASSKVDDSKCNTPCTGYGQDNCGGTNYWSVYLTGTESSVSNYGGSSSSATSSTTASSSTSTTSTSAATSPTTTALSTVVTSVSPGTTIVVTEPAHTTPTSSASPTQSSKSGGSNTAGIAAGVVVGVVAAAAIIAAIYFWRRHKKKQEAEAGYKPGQDYKGSGIRPPPTAYSQMSDARLDPEAGRRNSSGSIADDQDYSRRILRVANPSD